MALVMALAVGGLAPWEPPVAAAPADEPGAADYAADLPRIVQVPAGEARATLRVAEGFAVELMAAEPLLASPVAIAWDEDGRLFVAEMRGYSEHKDEKLGRIRQLFDDDGDGVYDRAAVFADGLLWPTALCCSAGGLFVGDAPVDIDGLRRVFREAAERDPTTLVVIKADASVSHGRVVTLMDLARSYSLTRLAIATDPEGKASAPP
jgi:glucose/arabinose dehydrogenase